MSLIALAAGIVLLGAEFAQPELPALLQRGAAEMTLDLAFERLSVPNGTTLPNEKGLAREIILSPAEPMPEVWRDVAVRFAPESRLWVMQGWPEQPPAPGEAGLQDWREALAAFTAEGERRAAAFATSARIIPVAAAFERAAQAIPKGGLPGIDSPAALYRPDGGLNDRGLYLVAMTTLASLTGRSPEGLTPRLSRLWMSRDSVVSAPMAQALQAIAWAAVSELPSPQPPLAPLPQAGMGGIEVPGIGFNLSGIADWSPQLPFLDLMKSARNWSGNRPEAWGAVRAEELEAGGWLDAQGWPKALPPGVESLSTLIFADLSPEAGGIAGRYHLTHKGRAKLTLGGRVEIVSQRPGELIFDYRPGPGNVVLTLSEIDPADPPRALSIVRADRRAAFEAGEIFNPDWLDRLRAAEMLRFMDWMQTNTTQIATAAEMPQPGDYSYTRRGVPLEVILQLAETLGADPWITLPHRTTDALARELAIAAHGRLPPGRKLYLELSNEVWNHMFPQSQWAEAEGLARWGQKWTWVQYYALRSAQIAEIWREVFADDPSRLVRVIGTQTAWLGLAIDILDAPLVQAEGLPAPHRAFDAMAVTGYVGGALSNEEKFTLLKDWLAQSRAAAVAEAQARGLSGRAAQAHIEAHRFDLAFTLALEEMRDGRHSGKPTDTLKNFLEVELPFHKAEAEKRGLKLVMYEGGSHAVGQGPSQEVEEFTAFFIALNYTAGMGKLYRDLIDGWRSFSDAPFAAFVDVAGPSKYGAWGALRHLADDNPRWRALAKGASE